MRYAMIMAGGSGTRLWPMSTREQPKQLIPFIESSDGGRSLLEVAMDRLDGLVEPDRTVVCAGNTHREAIQASLGLDSDRFFGEPMGRDTLNAVALVAYAVQRTDPEAVIAVFTADHLITPVDEFQEIVDAGYRVAESADGTLVTFGITPTSPATGFGYLELGEPLPDSASMGQARVVDQFREKPHLETAEEYLAAGADRYLWNSGMFVWKAMTLIDGVAKFHPDNHAGLTKIADAWGTPDQDAVLEAIYPTLNKISVDFAVMEPASTDSEFTVAAVPMPLRWLDVGSWPSYAETLTSDAAGNTTGGCRSTLLDTTNTLVASDDPDHLITTIGLDDVVVIHTAKATLVCRREDAERIKEMHGLVGEQHGDDYL